MRQKTAKNQWNGIVLIKLRPHYFNINSKLSFPQRACNYLLHSTTNHFFSFHLCPIGKTLSYSVRYYPVVTFLANRYNLNTIPHQEKSHKNMHACVCDHMMHLMHINLKRIIKGLRCMTISMISNSIKHRGPTECLWISTLYE